MPDAQATAPATPASQVPTVAASAAPPPSGTPGDAGVELPAFAVTLETASDGKRAFVGRKAGAVAFRIAPWDKPTPFIGRDAIRAFAVGADLVFVGYSDHSDSGASVAFVTREGKFRWSAVMQPAGVAHSKYNHEITATLRDGKLILKSVGSFAVVVEEYDPKTGELLKREVRKNP